MDLDPSERNMYPEQTFKDGDPDHTFEDLDPDHTFEDGDPNHTFEDGEPDLILVLTGIEIYLDLVHIPDRDPDRAVVVIGILMQVKGICIRNKLLRIGIRIMLLRLGSRI